MRLRKEDVMRILFYTIELILVLIATISCSINNFINGCVLVGTVEKYSIVTGITEIILSISLICLSIAFYKFYKLVIE